MSESQPGRLPPSSSFWVNSRFGVLQVNRWDPALIDALHTNGLTTLRITDWDQPDLASLLPLRRTIRKLTVTFSRPTLDLSAISEFEELEELTIGDGWPAIRFDQLQNLKLLAVHSPGGAFDHISEARNLRTLYITNCGLHDLSQLRRARGLTELHVGEAPLRSLAGLEHLHALERLVLHTLPLSDLTGLRALGSLSSLVVHALRRLASVDEMAHLPTLTRLVLDVPKKLSDLAPLGELVALRELSLYGPADDLSKWIPKLGGLRALRLNNVGLLPSLGLLEGLRSLEFLALEDKTTVSDGDMSVLLRLPQLRRVSYQDRRNYTPKKSEIVEGLATKN